MPVAPARACDVEQMMTGLSAVEGVILRRNRFDAEALRSVLLSAVLFS
jgi:hypothetical protein